MDPSGLCWMEQPACKNQTHPADFAPIPHRGLQSSLQRGVRCIVASLHPPHPACIALQCMQRAATMQRCNDATMQRSTATMQDATITMQRCNDQEPAMTPAPPVLSHEPGSAAAGASPGHARTVADILGCVVAARDLDPHILSRPRPGYGRAIWPRQGDAAHQSMEIGQDHPGVAAPGPQGPDATVYRDTEGLSS